jgi:hypothetical protein
MVKAVNKLILEINNTENEYFEKAVLYIRPERANDSKLGKSAEEYLKRLSTGGDTRGQGKSGVFISVLINIAVATLSATATAVVLLLCFV